MESQLNRPSDREHAEAPIEIHHPEEEEHHEKGAAKVLKKVKAKAKKIKNTLTKHGHHHDHDQTERHVPDDHDLDEEDDEDDEDDEFITDPEVHGAPMYESAAIRGGVTGQPESLSHPGKSHIPAPEEIVPPGTKVFPVVPPSQTELVEPVRGSEPVRGFDASHGYGGLAHPTRVSDMSDREESREAHLTPQNTPVSLHSSGTEDVARTFLPGEDKSLGQRKVNLERPRGMEEDPAAPGGGSGSSSVVSNYQSKVTDPTGKSCEEAGVTPIIESLGKMKVTDVPHEISDPRLERESTKTYETNVESGRGLEEDSLTKSPELDVKSRRELGEHLLTGSHDQFSPELSPPRAPEKPPTETEAFDSKPRVMADDVNQPKQGSYTEKIVSATTAIADKAAAAKNAVASKLGYSEEGGGGGESRVGEETPRSATEYGKKMASTVREKLAPVYEKVKGTGTSVMAKMPLSGGSGGEIQEGQDKGVSARDYLAEKLKPGEEDKALSEVIAEKLQLGGENKRKGTVTESVEVEMRLGGFDAASEKEKKLGESVAGDENNGGMVDKLRVAVTTWLGGTTEEVVNNSTESVQKSSQSLGSTIGTRLGLSGSNGGDVGETASEKKLQESGN